MKHHLECRYTSGVVGAIAQLGERYNGIVEVSGSIPLGSTINIDFSKFRKFVGVDASLSGELLVRRLAEGQGDVEFDALFKIDHANLAVMAVDDGFGDGQAQAANFFSIRLGNL